jgi:NAD(P)-dependent dehydrogenase (short-subunit alcohol dehydrogenase family)
MNAREVGRRALSTVLVTGASSGIGHAVARALAARGHRVFAAARRLDRLVQLEHHDSRISAIPMNVADPGSIDAAAERITEMTDGQGVHAVINNAGYALSGPVVALSGEAVRHQYQTNVFGVLDVTRAFIPPMLERGAGRIINVSSVLGRVSLPGLGIYSSTKFALEGMSDALRVELASRGIDVVLIEPGFVRTELGAASATESERFHLHGDAYEDLVEKTASYVARWAGRAGSIDTVVAAVTEAVVSPSVRARYSMPRGQRHLFALLRLAPDRVVDGVHHRLAGL